MTVSQALREAARALAAGGVPSPEADAELLLRHALAWDRAALVARSGDELDAAAAARFQALLLERSRRVPLQHIVGSVEFWRRRFAVSPAALIPRPETELLVETALLAIERHPAPLLVDVGTGSGCVALSIAGDRPDARVHAIDVSAEALALARQNARRLGLEARVTFHEGDLLGPVARLAGRADLIACNPPYLDAAEIGGLEPEVRDHEPRLALLPTGGDRLTLYRRLARDAPPLLAPGGVLVVEIGAGMQRDVGDILAAAGWSALELRADLQGHPRVVLARR